MQKLIRQIIIVLITILVLLMLVSCKKSDIRNSRIAVVSEDFQVSITNNGTIKQHGANAEQYDFSHWKDIISVESNQLSVFGLKKDGTVLVENLYDDEIYSNIDSWENIVMIDGMWGIAFGLDKDGTVHVDGIFNTDLVDEIAKWKDIVYIDAGILSFVGVDSKGRVYSLSNAEKTKQWKDVTQVSTSFWRTVGLRKDGDMYVANTIGNQNYHLPYRDIIGAKKVFPGGSFVAGLMPDGTVKIRSVIMTAIPPNEEEKKDIKDEIMELLKPKTPKEVKEIYEYNQSIMEEDYKAIDGMTDVVDIDVDGEIIAVLKKDGTVLVAGTNED